MINERQSGKPAKNGPAPAGLKRRHGRGWLAGLVFAALLSACSQFPEIFEQKSIRDEEYQVKNPSRDHALATGKGCAGIRDDALASAKRVAEFNLRAVTGSYRYRVEYKILREFNTERKICFEVSARAIP